MNKILNIRFFGMAALCVVMGLMTGCGGEDPVPAPAPDPTPINNDNQQEQPVISNVKVIEPSAIKEDVNNGVLSVSVDEQPEGSAVMTVTKDSSKFRIVGSYDSEARGYVFNLSNLEMGETYQYVISVYDKDNQKVLESKSRSISIPESAVIDGDGSGGGSDGTRGGAF
jgi:hypothetical protein